MPGLCTTASPGGACDTPWRWHSRASSYPTDQAALLLRLVTKKSVVCSWGRNGKVNRSHVVDQAVATLSCPRGLRSSQDTILSMRSLPVSRAIHIPAAPGAARAMHYLEKLVTAINN